MKTRSMVSVAIQRASSKGAAGEPFPSNQETEPNDVALLDAYSQAVTTAAAKVSPSVVYIQVVEGNSATPSTRRQSPGTPRTPNQPPSGAQVASGSVFVLDKQGHIITNDHVVEGADFVLATAVDLDSVEDAGGGGASVRNRASRP